MRPASSFILFGAAFVIRFDNLVFAGENRGISRFVFRPRDASRIAAADLDAFADCARASTLAREAREGSSRAYPAAASTKRGERAPGEQTQRIRACPEAFRSLSAMVSCRWIHRLRSRESSVRIGPGVPLGNCESSASRYSERAMKILHGRVEHGHVVVDEQLPEGTEVSVVVAAGDSTFDLDEAQIAALREAVEEADRGALVPLEDVFRGR